jgi:hypothetical protein
MKKPPDSPTFKRFTEAVRVMMKVPKSAVEKPPSFQKKPPK